MTNFSLPEAAKDRIRTQSQALLERILPMAQAPREKSFAEMAIEMNDRAEAIASQADAVSQELMLVRDESIHWKQQFEIATAAMDHYKGAYEQSDRQRQFWKGKFDVVADRLKGFVNGVNSTLAEVELEMLARTQPHHSDAQDVSLEDQRQLVSIMDRLPAVSLG